MKPIAPNTGAPEVTFASDQPQYIPVVIGIYEREIGKGLLTRWTFTDEERQAIANGEDIYVMQLNFNTPMTPMKVTVGPQEFEYKSPTDLT